MLDARADVAPHIAAPAPARSGGDSGARDAGGALSAWFDRWGGWVAFGLSAAIVAVVYGQALRFAFTFDDPLDLPRAEGRSVWSLFRTSEGYAYYRPIPFVLWKGLRALQGRYSAATLHGLTLVAHALAGWLLCLLLRRLTKGHWGLLAMVLFLIYPFSYQVVFGAHTLFHPLMTAAILASLLLYLDARRLMNWPRLAASVAFAFIALWTHESGVVLLPLVAGAELFLARQNHSWRVSWWPSLHAAATGLFLLVWFTVPKWPAKDSWTPASLVDNGRYFLQGVIYPVSAQLNGWGTRFHFDPVRALWPATALTLVLLFLVYRAGRRAYVPLLALSAASIALFPAWLVLRWTYVVDAPRLLYPASSAIAALWGLLPSLKFRRRWATVTWRAGALFLIGLVLAQSLAFIGLRRDMWAEGTKMIDGVVDTAAARPNRPLLFLNVPAWFAPKRQEYPVGHSGLTALPGYVGLGQSVYLHRGVRATVESRGFYPDLNGWKYDFNTHGEPATLEQFDELLRRVSGVYRVDMLATGATIVDVGALQPGNVPTPALPRFGPGFVLLNSAVVLEGTTIEATIEWGVSAPPSGDYLPVLALRDASGQALARTSAYPIGGISAPRLWRVGDQIVDRPHLTVPDDLAPGAYSIALSWEEKTTRQPLAGEGPDGAALPATGLVIGQFAVP